jgi:uncharacterized protein
MSKPRIVAAALLLGAFAAPAAAQFSDNYEFFKAVEKADGGKATTLLSKPGSTLVNAKNDTGDTALHIVTRRRDVPWMNLMLVRGANPNAEDRSGSTPLIIAAELGFVDGLEMLLNRGANPNVRNRQGETALIKAVQQRDVSSARVLLAAGADPDISDSVAGYSAREYAEQDRRAGAILRLIKEADARKKDAASAAASAAN